MRFLAIKHDSIILIICLLVVCLTGCTSKEITPIPLSRTEFKLNTMVTITLYDSTDEEILTNALALCDYYENLYSRTLENSELYKLNNGLLDKVSESDNSYVVSNELIDILEAGLYYSSLSQGKFDITVEPLSSLWNFTSKDPIIPMETEIKKAMNHVGYKDLTIEGDKVTFQKEGMGIDLGAIAKGYIADRIKEYLISVGVNSAMINLGGNVLCIGNKPTGMPYRIGIQKPFADRNEIVAMMDITDLSVVSSGVYERYFEMDNKNYHHILDPRTGYPYESDIISVTIISNKSVDGDGLSTTCFALGLHEGMNLINSLADVYAVFITSDYELHYSEGFFDTITVTEVE